MVSQVPQLKPVQMRTEIDKQKLLLGALYLIPSKLLDSEDCACSLKIIFGGDINADHLD